LDWTAGYRTDIDYTFGYYSELAPGQLDFALLLAGVEPPQREGLRYLELGYGQGISAAVHAAASPGEYWGADFNPSHAAHAQGLARASGAAAEFTDESFAEMLARDDLPAMDYIVMHGIWSWISDETRRVLVETFRKRLRVGGCLFFSYNTYPGWTASVPLRHLIATHAEHVGSASQATQVRDQAALAFGAQLVATGARYFEVNPRAKTQLETISGQDSHYVAHEYFNGIQSPMYFSEADKWLSDAKLSYAGAASPLEQLDVFNLTAAQSELLGGLGEGVMRETVRDFMLNRSFRRDLYTRGARRLSPLERRERLHATRIVLGIRPEDAPTSVLAGAGQAMLREEIYRPIIDRLAEAEGPITVGALAADPKVAALPPGAVIEAVAVLIGHGSLHPANSDAAIAAAQPQTARLNAHLTDRARMSGQINYLASPVTGGALAVSRFEQMFLSALNRGRKTPAAWAKDAWEAFSEQNQGLAIDGERVTTAEASIERLTRMAKAMADTRLPLLRRLKVVD
jgi:SAM-dependent methyltransferase